MQKFHHSKGGLIVSITEPTAKEINEAMSVLYFHFLDELKKKRQKPVTMLEANITDVFDDGSGARIFVFFTFYGKDELPMLQDENGKQWFPVRDKDKKIKPLNGDMCPFCKKPLFGEENHCENCGQAIDWSK